MNNWWFSESWFSWFIFSTLGCFIIIGIEKLIKIIKNYIKNKRYD